MKKFLAILGSLLIIAVLGITAFFSSLPRSAPPSAETVEVTPTRLARGEYLFNAVLGCPVCHSERDFSLFGAPPVQPFGGGRASGTNDKAGGIQNMLRWTSPRSIKETFVPPTDYRYPFMV